MVTKHLRSHLQTNTVNKQKLQWTHDMNVKPTAVNRLYIHIYHKDPYKDPPPLIFQLSHITERCSYNEKWHVETWKQLLLIIIIEHCIITLESIMVKFITRTASDFWDILSILNKVHLFSNKFLWISNKLLLEWFNLLK